MLREEEAGDGFINRQRPLSKEMMNGMDACLLLR
jgi:hypothetical protein